MNTMKGLVRRVGSGERGFTLIELLVVVAILGIIAAVVVLNIGSFIGSGAEQAANTEAHQVQTAVIAYMADAPLTTWTGSVGPASVSPGPVDFLLNPGTLQATYSVVDGTITSASYAAGSKWDGLVYNPGTGWAKTAPTT